MNNFEINGIKHRKSQHGEFAQFFDELRQEWKTSRFLNNELEVKTTNASRKLGENHYRHIQWSPINQAYIIWNQLHDQQFHVRIINDREEALALYNSPAFGPQEPAQDERVFNRRQPDGSFRPVADFFNKAAEDV